jgi:hypothetical protein
MLFTAEKYQMVTHQEGGRAEGKHTGGRELKMLTGWSVLYEDAVTRRVTCMARDK